MLSTARADVATIRWGDLPSTAFVGRPISATFSLLDTNGVPVSASGLQITAGIFQTNISFTVLGPQPQQNGNNSGRFILGNKFVPKRDLRVTHLRGYFGIFVRITHNGTVLAQTELPDAGGSWSEFRLPNPIRLRAGEQYKVESDSGGKDYYSSPLGAVTIDNDDLTMLPDSGLLWMADFRYTPDLPLAVVTPGSVDVDSTGGWAGPVSVDKPGGYVYLRAEVNGVVGYSRAIQILSANDVVLSQTISTPRLSIGDVLVYALHVSNTGPDTATRVKVNSTIPAGTKMLAISSTQGEAHSDSGSVAFDLGSLPPGIEGDMKISVQAASIGNFSQRAEVTRDEPDAEPANNSVASQLEILPLPRITVKDALAFVTENRGPNTNLAVFEVTLSSPSSREVLVGYGTQANTADAGSDFQSKSGILVFPPGTTKQTVNIPVMDNTLDEPNEDFYLRLYNPVNALLERDQAQCQIIDPNPRPLMTVDDVTVAESDDEFGTEAVFVFHLSNPSLIPITADIQTVRGTAGPMVWPGDPGEGDYYEVSGGVGFNPGEIETTLAVPINGDDFPEGDEKFKVYYSSTQADTLAQYATATILNDDPDPVLTVRDAVVREDSVQVRKLLFQVQLSKATGQEVYLNYQTLDQSAIGGIDFQNAQDVLYIPPGQRGGVIEITVNPDTEIEGTEDMMLSLLSASGCRLGNDFAIGTILDAFNQPPTVEFASPAYGSNNAFGGPVNVTVNAADSDGRITRIDLKVNGTTISQSGTASLSYPWQAPAPGLYTFIAQAFDNRDASTITPAWVVEVVSSNPLQLTSPANASTYPANEFVPIRVRYTGAAPLTRVDLLSDNAVIATLTPPETAFAWSNPSEGMHQLTARAADANGGSYSADPIQITIAPPRPANDFFANSITLSGYAPQAEGNTRGATIEPGEPAHGRPAAGATIWWNWTAPGSGTATLLARNDRAEPVYAAIYIGEIDSTLLQKAQFAGTGSFTVTSGQRYSIAIDGVGAYIGPVWLKLALSDIVMPISNPPASFRAPAVIPLVPAINAPSSVIQKVEFFEGATLIGAVTTPPYRFDWQVDTNGNHQVIAVATDYLGGTRSSAVVPIVVRPHNDNFEDAIELSGYEAEIQTSNIAATLQGIRRYMPGGPAGEPVFADNQGGHSIWYRWTAPDEGLVALQATGDKFYPMIAIYLGNNVSNLTYVAANAGSWMEPLSFRAAKGTAYNISLDGTFGEQGAITWSFALRPPNDNFANAHPLNTADFEMPASTRGGTLEPFEAGLHLDNSLSVWWVWRAPATGLAHIETASEQAPTQIAVYTGATDNLQSITTPLGDWLLKSATDFPAREGILYRIAVLAPAAETHPFIFRLREDVLTLTSPSPGIPYLAESPLQLAVAWPPAVTDIIRVEYFANGASLGASEQEPFQLLWTGAQAGTYKIRATASRSNGEQLTSLPTEVILYAEQNALPRPLLLANSRGSETWVMDSVGSLAILGSTQPQFGAPAPGEPRFPLAGTWPAGVSAWARMFVGISNVTDSLSGFGRPGILGFHTWSLTPDGVLYKDGSNRVTFPVGVKKWISLFGSGSCVAVGDNGWTYANGTNRIEFGPPGIAWRDIAFGSDHMARLSKENDLYVSQGGWFTISRPGSFDELPTAKIITANGLKFSEMQVSAHALVLRGTDGNLHQLGDLLTKQRLTNAPLNSIPLPDGVTRFTQFSVGSFHALALGDDGEIYSWGRNWEGQLGIGFSSEPSLTPQKVIRPPGVNAWTAVAAGRTHSSAIGNDCQLYMWGGYDKFQFSLAQIADQSLPHPVGLDQLCPFPTLEADALQHLPDGSIRLHFGSVPNQRYAIQYSDDLERWTTVLPAVTAQAGVLEWIDDGPPKTGSNPRSSHHRFYRIIVAP